LTPFNWENNSGRKRPGQKVHGKTGSDEQFSIVSPEFEFGPIKNPPAITLYIGHGVFVKYPACGLLPYSKCRIQRRTLCRYKKHQWIFHLYIKFKAR